MIQILQGNRNVLWTALSGSVALLPGGGWPVSIDGNDLGGALVIERPADGSAGVIEFGEKPKSIVFDLEVSQNARYWSNSPSSYGPTAPIIR